MPVSISASIDTLKSMIRAGLGITLIPRMAVNSSVPDNCLVLIPLKPSPVRAVRIVTRKTSRLGPLLAAALKGIMAPGAFRCLHEARESDAEANSVAPGHNQG